MAIQNNRRTLGEYRGGKSKYLSAGFLDLFIGSADFTSICRTMRIMDPPTPVKENKK